MIVDDATTGEMEIRLFEVCEVRVGGRPLPPLRYRKDLWLLALLALRAGRDTPRDWLAVTLWPDADESQALYNLRRSLSHLRRALGAEAARLLSPTPRTVRLDLTGAFADVVAFDQAIETEATEDELECAVALYRGPLLADCPDEWVIPERNAREQAYFGALERLAHRLAAQGEPAAARPLRLLIGADPYRESAYCALMQALSQSGDRAALGQVYQSLRVLLRRDLNADPAPETQALYRRLSAQDAQSVILPDAAPTRRAAGRHLPVPLTDLIGRQEEIEEIAGWLHQVRLVTLLGPGGVGKTRLAIAAAEAALPQFPEGVWFVDFAPLTDAGGMADAVVRTLGMTEAPGRTPEARLTEALADRALLLVLDNCEHVLEACAPLVQTLLTSSAGLRVLATSRQPLGLIGEQAYRVPSLAMPPEVTGAGEKDPSALLNYAAVRLFVERARQAGLSFRLTPHTASAAADICRRLDGIPLALEMAAARTRSLSVEEINTRLGDRFRLLTGGNKTALPRQRTLRALIDWSYDLLTEPEKALLACLSIFAGGWTLEAAESVGAGNGVEGWEVLDLLTALTDKSLVSAETEGDHTRYRLLETIRQYAAERLAAEGDEQGVRARHRDWFLALAEAGEDGSCGLEARHWLDRLEADHDNLRAALDECLEDSGREARRAEAGLRLTKAMTWFWAVRGYMTEGRTRMERALACPVAEGSTLCRARLLGEAATLAFNQADLSAAQTLAAQALALSEALGDREGEAQAHLVFGWLAHLRGDQAGAQTHGEQSLTLFRALGDQAQAGWSLHHLGLIARQRGDLTGAQELLEEALALGRALGYTLLIANALNNLAWVRQEQDDLAGARARSAEALVLMRDLGERSHVQTLTLLHLGGIALQEAGTAHAQGRPWEAPGHLAEARDYLAEGMRLAHAGGHRESGLSFLEFWSFLLPLLGRPARAAHVLGAAQALRVALGVPVFPGSGAGAAIYLDHVSGRALKAALGEAAFASAHAEGGRLSWEQAVDYALADADAAVPQESAPA